MRTTFRRQAGFTLIELIMVIVITASSVHGRHVSEGADPAIHGCVARAN